MNSVGIDVSKGKSTIAIMRPFGEIVSSPFEINHTEEDFEKLVSKYSSCPPAKSLPVADEIPKQKSIKYFLTFKCLHCYIFQFI